MQRFTPLYRLKREATRLAREQKLPRHAALDRIARREGFRTWSHLARSNAEDGPARALYGGFAAGDLVLLGARPGQGKTLLGLELIREAVRLGRHGLFFTLEYSARQLAEPLETLGIDPDRHPERMALDLSDGICARHVLDRLEGLPTGSLAVIDYLQLLDQKRHLPALGEQLVELREGARRTGAVIVALSQIDRAFDAAGDRLPGLEDVRLPNPADLSLFSKACFLHEGRLQVQTVN